MLPGVPFGGRLFFGAAAVVFAWAAFWVRLTTDRLGATVYYCARRSVRWADVDEVMIRMRWGIPALVLSASGRDLTVWAVAETIKGGGLKYCRRATREIQQTWSTATGRPVPEHVEGPELRGEDSP